MKKCDVKYKINNTLPLLKAFTVGMAILQMQHLAQPLEEAGIPLGRRELQKAKVWNRASASISELISQNEKQEC